MGPEGTDSVGRLPVSTVMLEGRPAGSSPLRGDVVAVGIPVFWSDDGPAVSDAVSHAAALAFAEGEEAAVGESLGELSARRGFCAKAGEAMVVVRPRRGDADVVYLGCGALDGVGLDARQASSALVRNAGRSGRAVFVLSSQLAEAAASDSGSAAASHRRAAQAVAEGAVLGAYRFSVHKTKDERDVVEELVIAGFAVDETALSRGTTRGVRVAEAVCVARDLVNEPPSLMTPTRMAEIASRLFEPSGRAKVEIWDPERISAERLGGLMGVARGSAEPARLIKVAFDPESPFSVNGRVPHVVLVGKGITFDSGGLSLKSADGMVTMKTDMSGAAAVLATVSACADLGVRVQVTAIAPVTENMPGGRATKPGDVLTTRDGQTIEVLNTDAEGRLILADGLSLAAELEPDAIVDVATLTGAAVVALGTSIAGLFSNDEDLADRLRAASSLAGEPLWRLPLPEQYDSHIESEVADMKNTGKPGQAGSIAAALLLQRFVNRKPWAHIDMAGPARSEEDEGIFAKGGTGFAVRTLLEMLCSYGSEEDSA